MKVVEIVCKKTLRSFYRKELSVLTRFIFNCNPP